MDKKSATEYACPMKCEGDKVYEKPGDCPVCNMHLVPVDENGKHTDHQHIEMRSEHNNEVQKKKKNS